MTCRFNANVKNLLEVRQALQRVLICVGRVQDRLDALEGAGTLLAEDGGTVEGEDGFEVLSDPTKPSQEGERVTAEDARMVLTEDGLDLSDRSEPELSAAEQELLDEYFPSNYGEDEYTGYDWSPTPKRAVPDGGVS